LLHFRLTATGGSGKLLLVSSGFLRKSSGTRATDKLYIKAAPGTEKDNCQDAKHFFEKALLEEANAP
jgi:hypothetical protein